MVKDSLGAKESVTLATYRNEKMIDFINRSFPNNGDRSVAWALFAHIVNEYPEAGKVLRGELVGFEELEEA